MITMAALLAIAGCSGESADDPQQSAAEAPGATSSDAPDGDNTDDADGADTAEPTSAPAEDTGSDDNDADDLVVTVDGEETAIDPTAVYCSGSEGNIHHIIGKTDNGPPLVKAEGTHFAMVKTGHQRPYKAQSPDGVEYHKDRVTFTDTELDSATLNGTMVCTDWED